MNYKYINLDYLDLMSDGDIDMKKVMIEMLLGEIPVEIEKLQQCQQEADWNQLKEVSHKLKSTLAFVGNPNMTSSNERIEEIAKTETGLQELPALISSLQSIYPSVLEELESIFAAMETV